MTDSFSDRLELSRLNKQCHCSNSQLWLSLLSLTSLRGMIKGRKFKTDSSGRITTSALGVEMTRVPPVCTYSSGLS